VLDAVSCASASSCVATGSFAKASGYYALAEEWDGSSWKLSSVPIPAAGAPSVLDGVSCNPGVCTAVGYYFNRKVSDYGLNLIERLVGTTWTVQPAPELAGTKMGAQLNAVSCTSPAACTAVGLGSPTSSAFVPIAERWNGKSWLQQTLPAASASLDSVSCPSANYCLGTGQTEGSSASTFAAQWQGSKWTAEAPTNPAAGTSRTLAAVSCASVADCAAVGSFFIASAQHIWAESWNGTKWQTQATINS
jgi:hypothetical protein